MAREYGKVKIDIHNDETWRMTSALEKSLYYTLLSHPKLSYAGVTDWRPNRLAPMIDPKWGELDVRTAGERLAGKYLIVTDDATEEVLVRSFIKRDGVMKQPRLAVAMASAFGAVSSELLRKVIAFEVQELRKEEPDLACWQDGRLRSVLDHSGLDVREFGQQLPSSLASVSAAFGPNVDQALVSHTTTTTTTTTEASLLDGEEKLKSTRLPSDWVPSKAHYDLALERRIDIAAEAEAFRLHAETHDRHAARWNAAFTTWLKKAKPKPQSNSNAWMDRSNG